MLRRVRSKLTYANVMSSIAVFLVLGGTAYAIADNSVRSRHIKNEEVKTGDIDNGTIKGVDLGSDVYTTQQVSKSSQHLTGESFGDSVACPAGTRVTGGGWQLDGPEADMYAVVLDKATAENGWAVRLEEQFDRSASAAPNLTLIVYAQCLKKNA